METVTAMFVACLIGFGDCKVFLVQGYDCEQIFTDLKRQQGEGNLEIGDMVCGVEYKMPPVDLEETWGPIIEEEE